MNLKGMLIATGLLVCLAFPASAATCRAGVKHRAAAVPAERENGTAVGFHSLAAPIGMRLGVSEYLSLDLGAGFTSRDNQDDWALDGGIPITMKSWKGARALFRPGVLYENRNDIGKTTISAELEGEAFVAKNFSVSAALGIAHVESQGESRIRSTGSEFTNVGFHLYLFR